MLDYLSDFAFVLLVSGAFGLVLCLFGWLFETFVDTDKLVKKYQEIIDEEDEIDE